ncbi:MAG TPA: Hsp33 family molecular chaperone HslO [Cellvibrio sp.]
MPSNDLLHRFLFDDCDIRGEIVTLGDSYREVLSHNPQVPAIRRLLGEFLAAVGLLSSTLKFDGKIILQARGDGPLSTIMAECNHHNNLRGIVRTNPDIELSDELANHGSLQQLLGNGILVITIEPQRSENFGGTLERHQGIVPMDAENLAGCLEHYFYQSEQLSTRLWFAANNDIATGFLIQALPQQLITDEEDNQDKWETIITLADTIKAEELLELEHSTVLYRLFNEQPLRLYEPKALRFACSCSRERSANALLAIGNEEVESLLIEKGSIDIDCQFCNQHYHFAAEEVRKLLGGNILH